MNEKLFAEIDAVVGKLSLLARPEADQAINLLLRWKGEREKWAGQLSELRQAETALEAALAKLK